MVFLRDAFEVAPGERVCDCFAGRRVARELDDGLVAECEARAGFEPLSVEADDRHVLADRAGEDGVAFALEFEYVFEREEAESALRPAVGARVALPVAFESRRRQKRLAHGELGHAAVGAVELEDSSVHHPQFKNRDVKNPRSVPARGVADKPHAPDAADASPAPAQYQPFRPLETNAGVRQTPAVNPFVRRLAHSPAKRPRKRSTGTAV